MKTYKKLSKDLQRKFLLIGIIPVIIVSAFLFGKIYFIFEDISIKAHERVLNDIHFYINQLLNDITKEITFIRKHSNEIDIQEYIKADNEIDTITVFDRKSQKIIEFFTDINITDQQKKNYLLNNQYEQYKNIHKADFYTIHKGVLNNKKVISYILPTKKYIYILDINISLLKSYIKYLKKNIDYIILIVDKDGNYIYKTSNQPYFHKNFFTTEYYKKVVKKHNPFQYVEFFNKEQDIDNFMVYYTIPETGWTLVSIEDYDSLDDKVLALLPLVLLLLPLIILAIMISARKFTTKIILPLEILIEKMEKLSKTTDTKKMEVEHVTYSLFKRIIDSFNTMQNKIFQRENELKDSNELLLKKTQEISNINKNLQQKIQEEIEKNRKKDQQMLQQSRLAQMGEMMSMIAHQWRQPLAAISSTSSALEIKALLNTIEPKTVQNLAKKISEYSQHLSTTIDDFREFFKANKETLEVTYTQLIESVLNIVETSLVNKNITLIKDLKSEEVFTTYPNEIKQVILNLIKNAEDVLLERKVQNPKIIIITDGNILKISDNAGGIPEDILDKIFDPYFSTKKKKDGTGLGLYMSKTIVEDHCNGKLTVNNNEEGACFTIVLSSINQEKEDYDKSI